jgi:hypothetical protein
LLVTAAVPLFFLAALTESFVRESALGSAPRLALAGAYGVALLAAHILLQRRAGRSRVDTSWLLEVERREPGRPAERGSGSIS